MHSLEFKMFSLKGMKWVYRGEGNANLVISLPKTRQILRLRKSSQIDSRKISQDKKEKVGNTQCEVIVRNFAFFMTIMLPLMKPYSDPAQGVFLQESEIKMLNRALLCERPVHRIYKQLLDLNAVIYPDYTFLPTRCSNEDLTSTFCVELKPKQGWIPIPDRNLNCCNFCLNQHLKFTKETTKEISKYCPMDLYSGDKNRMHQAIKHLLSTPQNNLKIFKNGVLIYDDNKHVNDLNEVLTDCFSSSNTTLEELSNKLSEIIIEALTRNFTHGKDITKVHLFSKLKIKGNYDNDTTEKKYIIKKLPNCNFISERTLLPQDSVLDRIFRMQTLNEVGIKSAINIYREYMKSFHDEEKTNSPYALIDETLNNCCKYVEYNQRNNHNKEEDDIPILQFCTGKNIYEEILKRYLLFATARDCSIMITFNYLINKGKDNELNIIKCKDGSQYLVNVAVMDLDPKPISCIEKHWNDRHAALKACLDEQNSLEINCLL